MNDLDLAVKRQKDPHVLLETVQKAATAVGKRLTIGLTDAPRAA